MSKAITSHEGLSLNEGEANLTYLYGLSDFWSFTFEEPEVVNDVLEANTFMMSEAYSKFLQLTSTISLNEIQTTANSQIKLVLLSAEDAVEGSLEVNEYKLPEEIVDASFVSNRPFLPTESLDKGVHFHVNPDTRTIRFSKPLSSHLFPSRELLDGTTQYALWLTDARLDEEFIFKHYGKLLDVNPQKSLDVYKRYIRGLYYLYTNGPNVRTLERGLNLVMGVPFARETETIIYIQQHSQTNDWLVTTSNNSYRIPFGLAPTLSEGDTLTRGQELASWVEVDDWISQDNWWLNLSIPPEVLPEPPGGDSRATTGSDTEYLMSKFLKTHTFLVKLKTTGVNNLNIFQNVTQVVSDVKPSHTFPIYIWAVPLETEILGIGDGDLTAQLNSNVCENVLSANFDTFRRDNSLYHRGCPFFVRCNVTAKADHWISELKNTPLPYDEGGDGEVVPDPFLYSGPLQFTPSGEGVTITEIVGGITPEVKISSSDGLNAYASIELQGIEDGTYDIDIELYKEEGSSPMNIRVSETTIDPTVISILNASVADDVARNIVTGTFTLSSGATVAFLNFVFADGTSSPEGVSLYRVSLKLQGGTKKFNAGIIARQNVYEKGTFTDAWMTALHSRGSLINQFGRGHVTYINRGSTEGFPVATTRLIPSTEAYGTLTGKEPLVDTNFVIEDSHLLGLYNVREGELRDKMTTLGHTLPAETPGAFIVLPGLLETTYIELMIRDISIVNTDQPQNDLYNPTFIHSQMPHEGHRLRAVGVDAVGPYDFIVVYHSFDDVYGVFLYKQDRYLAKEYFNYLTSPESLKIDIAATEFIRSGMKMDSPVYLTRGALSSTYTDALTTLPVTFDRSNTPVNTINSEKSHI